MAVGTTRNSLNRLILSAPVSKLKKFVYDRYNPFIREIEIDNALHRQMLIPIVMDVRPRKRNRVVRELPVRATDRGRGTFKEFITSDDIYFVVDAMLTYHYEGELNFNVRNDTLEQDILNTLVEKIGQLGLIPPNDLQIRSRSDLVALINRLGITRTNLPSDLIPGAINEARRIGLIGNSPSEVIGANLLGTYSELARRERERNIVYPDQADTFPMGLFNYLNAFADVAGGLLADHPFLESLGVRNVVILDLYSNDTQSQHQMSITIEMVSDDPSIYDTPQSQTQETTANSTASFEVGPPIEPPEGSLEFFNTGGELPSLAPSPAPSLP